MDTVLANISKDNTRFTIFENDQVLTADQLNDLFNYLDVQSRLTRTQGIGIGIICGLEIGALANKNIVVSKGTAITSDGDLLYFNEDQEFDSFRLFEDLNAQYDYFKLGNNLQLPIYELLKRSPLSEASLPLLDSFETSTNTLLKDYVGVLYLEDYKNDQDLCTGTDCDNKGILASRELKVIIVHKDNMRVLLQSMPVMNKNYFDLKEIAIPRVNIRTEIDTYDELKGSFTDIFSIKEDIKTKLGEAYKTCQHIVEDEFEGDPTGGWSTALDSAFNNANPVYAQYFYDFVRDLSFAYNEMRESLFADQMLVSPDVSLFPKHVLLGLIRTASVTQLPLASPILSPINLFNPSILPISKIRFNIGNIIRRFNPIHIDIDYRHRFYESPVLSQNGGDQQTRFCFMRIHAMISNFKIPTAEELGDINQSLRITPSHFEDKPLGERSIPFYYRFNANLPLHLYWNFKANVRKKETEILSYFSNQYADKPATFNPLAFNLFPYNFFRVEGHIGFKLADVEAALNKLILDRNLPINIVSVQVEKNIATIPPKKWFFPHLHLFEKTVQKSFIDRLDQADIVNDDLKNFDNNILVSEFKIAKQTVLENSRDVADPAFNFSKLKISISNAVTAATNIKNQTKQYTFSNAAIPHDFVSNTDILQKTDILSNIYEQQIKKKKEGLMLGNFMRLNPGLEHAGGVSRGGTFVLVYTSNDSNVVADFMLPYASIDKDVVLDPPVYIPPLQPVDPPIIRFPVETVFERIPFYKVDLNETVSKYAKLEDLNKGLDDKVGQRMQEVESKLDLKLAVTNNKIADLAPQFASLDERLKSNTTLFDKVFTAGLKGSVLTPNTTLVANGKDFTNDIEVLRIKSDELAAIPVDAPDRAVKETELLDLADNLTKNLNEASVTTDPNNELLVKSVLADVHSSTGLINSPELKVKATDVGNLANNITKGFKLNR